MPAFLPLVRLVVLVLTSIFALIVLGLSAHLISVTEASFDGYFYFCALGVATAVLALISVPALLVLDHIRPEAVTSTIAVELGWLSILWVLWLATGADTADAANKTFPSGCGYVDSRVDQNCHEFAAIEAFSFINWLMLMLYTINLLVLAIMGASRGNPVWNYSVREVGPNSSQYRSEPKPVTGMSQSQV